MGKYFKFFKYLIAPLLAVQFFSCNIQTNKVILKPKHSEPEGIFGLYSYYTTGYNSKCETIKHSLLLNQDSSFVMRVYCYADSLSPYIPTSKNGKWTYLSETMFYFFCTDKTSFKAKHLDGNTIQIISEEISNYQYKRDTTTDEKFWQKTKQ